MTLITPDTSQSADMSPIEPNTYPAKIASCDFQMSSKGNPMIVPTFVLTVDGKERTRKSYIVTDGAGAFNFDQLLRACNFTELADTYKNPDVEHPPFDTDQLVGQELMVVIETQIYQGEKRDAIKTYLKA